MNIDEKLRNADWIRTGEWEAFLTENGTLIPVETEEQLKEWLLQQGMTMKHFKKLPKYESWERFKKEHMKR